MEIDKRLFELACREYLMDVVNKSKYLKEHLSLIEHAKVYNWTKNKASYKQLLEVIIRELTDKPVDEKAIKMFETLVVSLAELKPGYRWPWQGASKAAKSAGGKVLDVMTKERHLHPIKAAKKVAITAAIIIGAIYLFKKLMDPCVRQCRGNSDCIRDCRSNAIKKSIANLQSHLPNCAQTPNPAKCQAKIKKEIAKWNEKLTKLSAAK